MDKSKFKQPGPWHYEADRLEWNYKGFPCLIVRSEMGALCGYVGVPEGHPWFHEHYDDVNADVHGGLTYANECSEPICHVPEPGEPDNVWWLGFDCAHFGDYIPALDYFSTGCPENYKNLEYVALEVQRLADQAEMAKS